jgi:pilus assembly protein Flp/PilA
MVAQYVQYFIARLGLNINDEEEGQGLVEYALIIVLISIAAIVAMRSLSGGISGVFTSITGTLGGSTVAPTATP